MLKEGFRPVVGSSSGSAPLVLPQTQALNPNSLRAALCLRRRTTKITVSSKGIVARYRKDALHCDKARVSRQRPSGLLFALPVPRTTGLSNPVTPGVMSCERTRRSWLAANVAGPYLVTARAIKTVPNHAVTAPLGRAVPRNPLFPRRRSLDAQAQKSPDSLGASQRPSIAAHLPVAETPRPPELALTYTILPVKRSAILVPLFLEVLGRPVCLG